MSLRPETRYNWLEPRLIAVVVISSAAVLSTSIVVGGWKATHATATEQAPKTLEVTGESSRHLVADEMTWTITVHGRDSDRDAALDKLHTSLGTAHTYLNTNGVPDGELAFSEVATQRDDDTAATKDADGNETSEQVPGDWDATQTITVTTKSIGHGIKVRNEEATADDLVDSEVGDATCTSAKAESVQPLVLGEARTNVHAQAKLAIDQYGGASLGRLLTAQLGTVNVGTDCTDVIVSATATATYEIE